jgi:hypothetical protein
MSLEKVAINNYPIGNITDYPNSSNQVGSIINTSNWKGEEARLRSTIYEKLNEIDACIQNVNGNKMNHYIKHLIKQVENYYNELKLLLNYSDDLNFMAEQIEKIKTRARKAIGEQ